MAASCPEEPAAELAVLSTLPVAQLMVGWITLFVIGTDLFIVSPLIPLIARDCQADASATGLLVAAFACGYVIAAPAFGHLSHYIGRRRILVFCLMAFGAGNLMTSLAAGLPQMLAARLACGISAAGVTPFIYALVGDAAPASRRSTWIAVAVTGLLSALPLGATAGTLASSTIGWRASFMVLACLGLILALLNRLVWASAESARNVRTGRTGTLWQMALARQLLPTVAWSAALYGMYTYLGAGLSDLGYAPQQIAEVVFIYGIAACIGALIGGRVADRLGPYVAVRVSLAALCVAFAVLQLSTRLGPFIGVAVALTSLAAQTFFPAQQALLISAFNERSPAALSWNNSALFLGMTLGSLLGGQVLGAGGFTAIPTMSVGLTLVGLLACSRSTCAVGTIATEPGLLRT